MVFLHFLDSQLRDKWLKILKNAFCKLVLICYRIDQNQYRWSRFLLIIFSMVGEQTMSGTQEGCPAKFSLLQLDANLIEGEPYNHLTL